ncbi:MAG: hypothetical protein JWO10_237 [Microbacteriaceae bacterium]|jgi:hypothetical protein|nr:hypothetical protein [Microbacteriaceae bacterium]
MGYCTFRGNLEGFVKARIAASVVLAAALMLGTTACSFFATNATLKHYDPSDGVGVTVGDVQVRNAIVLTKDDGATASLLVNFINTGERDREVLVQYSDSTGKVDRTVRLDAGETKSYGGRIGGQQLLLDNITTTPGELFPIWVQYGDETGKQMLVPVLDGSQSEYVGLLPVPTPTATPTNIPGATLTPTPSATAK